jgi:hypothetical protein
MDDVKRTYREGEQTTKEAWRGADGEDLGDKIGNAGDELRKQAGNAGDALDDDVDTSNAKAEWRQSDGDESLTDKLGNAGDNIRDELDDRR